MGWSALMRKLYLHLYAFPCELCTGPVVVATTAVRENAISLETDIRQVGSICISCGHSPSPAIPPKRVRYLPPAEWQPAWTIAYVEARNRATDSAKERRSATA